MKENSLQGSATEFLLLSFRNEISHQQKETEAHEHIPYRDQFIAVGLVGMVVDQQPKQGCGNTKEISGFLL